MRDNDAGADARLCGWTDPPLSHLGRAQVAHLCERLAGEPPAEALYASPLLRARSTAQAIACALGIPVLVRGGLREINCGVLDGRPIRDVRRRYPALWRRNMEQTDSGFAWPGGESYAAFRERCLGAVGRIAAAHPGGRVLVVTHAGVITQVVGALHGAGPAEWGKFRVGNASVTEVEWWGDRPLPAPDGVRAPDDAQVVPRRAGGVRARA